MGVSRLLLVIVIAEIHIPLHKRIIVTFHHIVKYRCAYSITLSRIKIIGSRFIFVKEGPLQNQRCKSTQNKSRCYHSELFLLVVGTVPMILLSSLLIWNIGSVLKMPYFLLTYSRPCRCQSSQSPNLCIHTCLSI